ncbi:MAG: [protein-PII] uridylyltransferase [Acidobacteria bacterium]|nr:[protein-PII] uridylyltransferase [Acidobacteriota bacterium]
MGSTRNSFPPSLRRRIPGSREEARAVLADSRAVLRQRFWLQKDGLRAGREHARWVDALLQSAWREGGAHSHSGKATPDSRLALMALGGYGRRELYPFSDVDLLFLWRGKDEKHAVPQVKRLVARLWDLGLPIKQHVRSIEELDLDVRQNPEFAMALLDARLLAGDTALAERAAEQLARLLNAQRDRWMEELAALQQERYARFDQTIYHLEPDVKECVGGLRDLHCVHWSSRIRDPRGPGGPLDLPRQDRRRLREAHGFLSTIRTFLHFLNGWGKNLLTHEHQEVLARELGWEEDPGGNAVENLMRQYYLHSTHVARALRRHLFAPRARRHVETKPLSPSAADSPFLRRNGTILFASDRAVAREPSNLLRIFSVAAERGLQIDDEALPTVEKYLDRLEPLDREGPRVRDFFVPILRSLGGLYARLSAMHETGLLSWLFPEFESIHCRVVRDYFHKYTVDEHSLLAVKHLEELLDTEDPSLRRFRTLLEEMTAPEWLACALLFHDLGKAERGLHVPKSVHASERIVRRLELPAGPAEDITFFVRHHLLMSSILRKGDLHDEEVIRKFADQVGSTERLRFLCLGTYADVRAVNPTALSLWTQDRLWQLYVQTYHRITRAVGDERYSPEEVLEDLTPLVAELPDAEVGDLREFLRGFPRRYLRATPPERVAQHFRMAQRLPASHLEFRLEERDATYLLSLVAYDRPGLFARLTGVLASFGMNILRGEAFSNSAGVIVDVIEFEDLNRTFALNPSERERFGEVLRDVMLQGRDVEALLTRRWTSVAFRAPAQRMGVTLSWDDDYSKNYTLLEVIAPDRFGLLYQISKTLAQFRCNIDVALISTEGMRAIDVFYLTREGKKLEPSLQRDVQDALVKTLTGGMA